MDEAERGEVAFVPLGVEVCVGTEKFGLSPAEFPEVLISVI